MARNLDRGGRRPVATILLLGFLVWLIGTVPSSAAPLFSDGFETGDLSLWTAATGTTAQQVEVHSGAWAARATASGSRAYAYRQLATSQSSLSWQLSFKVLSRGANAVTLMSFATSSGGTILNVGMNAKGKLNTVNKVAGVTTTSSIAVSAGWHDLRTNVSIAGTSSMVQVWFDGAPVQKLTRSDSLGTAPVGRIYLGDTGKRTFDVAFDDALAEGLSQDVTAPSAPTGLVATPLDSGVEVDLSWSPSSDDVGVAGYTVYRDGKAIATLPGSATAYADTTVKPATTYVYAVDAFDAAGNRSATSDAVTTTTPDSPAQPVFSVHCDYSHSLMDDPIVHPADPGASHMHDFYGNTSTNAFSTYDSMTAATTLCGLSGDTAGYWTPQLILSDGTAVQPLKVLAYYRVPNGFAPSSIQASPPDLRIVAGGDTVGDPAHAYWYCGQGTPESSTPPNCGSAVVRGNVNFPACWDGVNLDSTNHRSHMAYPSGGTCPADHPVALPKLTLVIVYPATDARGAYLSSGDATTLHADFWNTWQQAALEQAVTDCLNAGLVCGELKG